jgi:hypothetical protein
MCAWDEAWVGKCKKIAQDGSRFCEEHKDKVCSSCGAVATHSCGETGQFVCGFPLCDDCEHITFPDGTNGGIGFMAQQLPDGVRKRHVKKSDQKFKPWFMQEEK